MGKGYQNHCSYIKGKDGILISDPAEIMTEWKKHFEELLNGEEDHEAVDNWTIGEDAIVKRQPAEGKVVTAIQDMKNNRSPGKNDICIETIKFNGEQIQRKIYQLLVQVWEKKVMPSEWYEARICPLHKKGHKLKCDNYRGIALLDTIYKTLARILRNKLNCYTERILHKYQFPVCFACGF
ncbi:unnamed protein product [Diabrotica balteata]|uniref:Uncharacterized protein n=1 Tax=Diabrotica balteata TaxID=107213 RepID=A0A9N9T350_DIABA|nr:unnamed protein product [Diabrotica balteata]